MNRRAISLRTAVIIPFLGVIVLILSIFIILWQVDYNWLAREQGTKLLKVLNDNTQQSLKEMLSKPLKSNQLFQGDIERLKYYDDDQLKNIEEYTKYFLSTVRTDMPQIAAISYGDEKGNYIGIRANDNNSLTLMLKDKRTNGILNIYNGDVMGSAVAEFYNGYDPRTRPWYAPVKLNPVEQWSDIYINSDEKMEATISSLNPVLDNLNQLKGVTCIDVNLNGINKFLKANATKGSGVIYIIDKNWNLIAHSGDEPVMKIIETSPPIGKIANATENKNSLISKTSKFLQTNNIKKDEVVEISIGNKQNFALISQMKEPQGLDWRVIVVIPEADLMGTVRSRQNIIISIVVFLSLIGAFIGLIILSAIIKPILRSSKAAVELSQGNWDIILEKNPFPLYEIEELGKAFNTMSTNLKESFHQIEVSKENYRSLVENMDDMIYSLSPEGKILTTNHSFHKVFGKTNETLEESNFIEIFEFEENIEFWKDKLRKINENKVKQSDQYTFLNHEHKKMIITVTWIPILNSFDELTMVLGSNTDITKLVEAQ